MGGRRRLKFRYNVDGYNDWTAWRDGVHYAFLFNKWLGGWEAFVEGEWICRKLHVDVLSSFREARDLCNEHWREYGNN